MKYLKQLLLSRASIQQSISLWWGPQIFDSSSCKRSKQVRSYSEKQRFGECFNSQIEWLRNFGSKDCCGRFLASKSEWSFRESKEQGKQADAKPNAIPTSGRKRILIQVYYWVHSSSKKKCLLALLNWLYMMSNIIPSLAFWWPFYWIIKNIFVRKHNQ